MSQHDLEWADQLFPPMRVDMNQALIALSTRQAGAGPPALVTAARPNRLYVDVTRKQILVRDNADTADFIQDAWAQDRCRLVTAAVDAFLPEDVGRLVMVNSAVPVAMSIAEAVGLFGPGWNSEVFNLGLGTLTITPATSLVNGGANVVLKQYQGAKWFSLTGQYWAALTGRGNATQDDLNAASIPMGTFFNHLDWTVSQPGYVRFIGGTMGDPTSGGTERANADTLNLYSLIWARYAQAQAPVAGGRGATALADWNAHKPMTLFDTRGRTVFTIDLGAGRLNGGYSYGLPGHVPGAVGGYEWHQLVAGESVNHTHGYVASPGGVGAAGEGGPYAGTYPAPPAAANTAGVNEGFAQTPFTTTPPGIAMGCVIAKL